MDGADQRPFASDVFEAAQEKLSKAAGLLDLTEHGLDNLLAQSIAAAPARSFELGGHLGDRAGGPGSAAAEGGSGAVPLAAGGDIAGDAAPGHGAQIGLGQ